MSRTLHEAMGTVRYHLRDMRVQSQAFMDPELVMALQSGVRNIAPALLLGEEWDTGMLSLVAGTDTYTLPDQTGDTGQVYAKLVKFRTQSDGFEIPILSFEHFERFRNGDAAIVSQRGTPIVAMLIEGPDQLTKARFWPTPNEADTVDGFRSLLPAPFYTPGGFALEALPTATTIPFDDQGFEALCWDVAADLFDVMPEEARTRNGLSPDAASSWRAKAAGLVRASRHRRLRQKSSTHVIRGRRW